MTVKDIVNQLNMTVVAGEESMLDKTVSKGYVCDLLSRVMANGEKDSLWITVQAHINVIALAALHEMACVVIPESIEIPQITVEKAKQENIVILSSELEAFTIAAKLPELCQ